MTQPKSSKIWKINKFRNKSTVLPIPQLIALIFQLINYPHPGQLFILME